MTPRLPLLLALAAVLVALATPAKAQPDRAPTDPVLRADLLRREAAEQDVRRRLLAGGFTDVARLDTALVAEMAATDAANLARVVETVERDGWPTPERVGRDGVHAAFLIVQHGDPETQERLFPHLEAAYRAGDLPGADWALFLDRVLVHRGEPQVYATQALPPDQWADGRAAVAPTVDDAGLDARRAEVGLPPIDGYLRLLWEVYRSGPAAP